MKSLIPLTLLAMSAPGWCQPCSNADLRGVYLLQTSGHVNLKDLGPGLPNLMGPMAAFGLVEYDGNGSVSGRLTGTWGGLAASFETVEARYSVNRDCTGTAEFKFKHVDTGQLVGPDRHRCVVLEDGDLVRCLMIESAGRTLINSTEMRRMNRGRRVCDSSMVRGSYGVHYDGWVNM